MQIISPYSKFTVGSGGLSLFLGNTRKAFLTLAVDVVAGQSTGTGVTVTVGGRGIREQWTVAYGAPVLGPVSIAGANTLVVVGSGAIIELVVDTEPVQLSPVTLTPGSVTATVSGTVNTDIGQRGTTLVGNNPVNLTPIESLAYLGGSPAPATGKWRFQATLTAGGTALQVKIGAGTATDILPVGTEGTPSGTQECTYELAVTLGTTYTVSNGTVVAGSVSVV